MFGNIVLVPFRDRHQQLIYFTKNTVPLIQKYLPDTKIVIIEQNKKKLFNRGLLLNIGFKENKNKTKYFFTHDIDLNPTKKFITEYYTKRVNRGHVLGLYTSQHDTLGGIIKINDFDIQKINGFPNNIWGWGCEDKALQNRTEYFDIIKTTSLMNNKNHPEYLVRFNDINDREFKNHKTNHHKHYLLFKKLNKKQQLQVIMSSGINNLKYTIIEKIKINTIEIIKVDI